MLCAQSSDFGSVNERRPHACIGHVHLQSPRGIGIKELLKGYHHPRWPSKNISSIHGDAGVINIGLDCMLDEQVRSMTVPDQLPETHEDQFGTRVCQLGETCQVYTTETLCQ